MQGRAERGRVLTLKIRRNLRGVCKSWPHGGASRGGQAELVKKGPVLMCRPLLPQERSRHGEALNIKADPFSSLSRVVGFYLESLRTASGEERRKRYQRHQLSDGIHSRKATLLRASGYLFHEVLFGCPLDAAVMIGTQSLQCQPTPTRVWVLATVPVAVSIIHISQKVLPPRSPISVVNRIP